MMKPTSKSGVARPPPEGQAAVGRSDPGAGKGGRERDRAGVWTPAGGPRPFHSPSSRERGPAPTPHLNPPFGDTVSAPCPCRHGKGRQGLTDLGHCSLKQESLSCDLRHQHGTWHCYPGLGGECSRGLLLPCGRSLNSSRVFHYPRAILFPRGQTELWGEDHTQPGTDAVLASTPRPRSQRPAESPRTTPQQCAHLPPCRQAQAARALRCPAAPSTHVTLCSQMTALTQRARLVLLTYNSKRTWFLR